MAGKLGTREARAAIAGAVSAVEDRSGAEVVVAVRPAADAWRECEWLGGAIAAFATVLFTLLAPPEFDLFLIPVWVAAAFGIGAVLVHAVPSLKRVMLPRRRAAEAVARAARAAMVELGVTRTRERVGVLVFVSVLERRAEVLTDEGVDLSAAGPRWEAAVAAVASAAGRLDAARLASAIAGLGPVLEDVVPRTENDVNELEDAPHVA